MNYSEAFDLLQQLIRSQAQSANVEAVNTSTQTMKDFLDRHGLHTTVETFQGRKVLFASKQPGKKHALLMNAHLDVVPPSEPGQFEPQVKDGKLYGRGANDDLCSAVAIAQTLVNARSDADVAAFFTTDEEIGGSTTQAMAEAGYVPTQIAVILDISSCTEIAVAQKGILVVKMTAHGKGGHSAEPWLSDNPLVTLATAIHKLTQAWNNPTETHQWQDSLAPCILQGGSADNQIPDDATAVLNVRFVTPGDEERILDFIRQQTGLQDLVVTKHCPPVECTADHPLINQLMDCLKKHHAPRTVAKTKLNGATDARHLAFLNLPIAITGIDGAGIHGKGEYVEIDSFQRTIDALTEYANSFSMPT